MVAHNAIVKGEISHVKMIKGDKKGGEFSLGTAPGNQLYLRQGALYNMRK